MYQTAEIRWILEGRLPVTVERWFGATSGSSPEERHDRYVVMPGCETVGIKLRGLGRGRGSRLEVKAMRGRESRVRLSSQVEGWAAAWSRWTLEIAGGPDLTSRIGDTTLTLDIGKRRLMRRLVQDGGRFLEVAPGSLAEEGCDIELTAIAIDGSDGHWWSLGLEAFGPNDRSRQLMRMLGAAWFAAREAPPLVGGPSLDLGSSRAYPAWLAGLLDSSAPETPPARG